jgi:UDP-N-acetylglucosamine 1-carboxyvinyltransferase
MQKFIIKGKEILKGEIDIAGAKNSALKLLPAALLTNEECRFTNVPEIKDVEILIKILKNIGVKIKRLKKGSYVVKCDRINKIELDRDLVAKLRASIMLIAPMLVKLGEVKFPHPGGCIIGKRPIDMYIQGYKCMGAQVTESDNYYHIKAKKLSGCKYVFPWISHTVTESMILSAVLAEGTTELINAACEPEVVALCEFLRNCGAKIKGDGTNYIKISGVKKLTGAKVEIIPDRIEAGTFAILAALIGDGIKLNKCNPLHLEVFLQMLKRAGVKFDYGKDYMYIYPTNKLKAVEARTHEYPGFATDLQAPFTILMTQANGLSLIHETIYEGRLFYTDTLNKMGANIIMCDPHRVVVNGPSKLYGTKMDSPDLRAGISLVLAAMIAEGKSEIENIYQIDRGYEDIEKRLTKLGADIKRIED